MLLELRKQINYYLEFKDWYNKIIKDFKFDYEKDNEAKDILSNIIKMKSNDWDFAGVLLAFCNAVKKKKKNIYFWRGSITRGYD
ncbi:MAG: hypothetical protein ACTSXN_12700 [Promethearchaeota archaeon]